MSKKRGTAACVEGFLELVCTPPDGIEKKGQRKQDICSAEIMGFNRAQETLRDVLRLNGTPTAAKLSEVEAEGQNRPQRVGGVRMWFG
jgi:hypothetical protein